MAPSRRRFLAGVAVALPLAGCNERAARGGGDGAEETVTPVEVPRSAGEVLRQAADVDSPAVDVTVPVAEAHLADGIGQVERLLEAAESYLEAAGDVDAGRFYARPRGSAFDPEELLGRVRRRLSDLREAEPSRSTLGTVDSAIRDLAPLVGGLAAEAGDTDPEALRRRVADERDARAAVRERIEYRLASPVEESLLVFEAAESRLGDGHLLERATNRLDAIADDENVDPVEAMAHAGRHLEVHERNRRDTELYRRAATDPEAPVRAGLLDERQTSLRETVADVAERFDSEAPASSGTQLAQSLRSARRSFGTRGTRWAERLEDGRRDGDRIRVLLDALGWYCELLAVDAAVERTVDRLEGGTVPAEAVLEEKQAAVRRVEALASGSTLQRRVGRRSGLALEAGDERLAAGAAATDSVVRAHLLYVLAAEFADAALQEGAALAEALSGTPG